jgi:SpoVK/Ycf46/Vps4 family AAA+-type ATPase
MSNDSAGAFIMVATNRPGDLDEAVLRRMPRRLLVDLPMENDRLEILKIHLRDEQLAPDVDLAGLAKKTPYYSGSDLKNLCVAAALSCVREENEVAKAHRGEQPYQHAEKRTLTGRHFSKALEEITASISEDMNSLKEIKKFDEQYGDKRNKRKVSKWGFKAANDVEKVLDTVKVRT